MYIRLLVSLFVFLSIGLKTSLIAQTKDSLSDQAAIIKTINRFFDGVRSKDTLQISSVLADEATLQSVVEANGGDTRVKAVSLKAFKKAVVESKNDVWDEQLTSIDAKSDGSMGLAWTPYQFFLNGKFLHCGVNQFDLIKQNGIWKILSIKDTRRQTNCEVEPIAAINALMNSWHNAAAIADEKVFFDSMLSGSYYIGTDATERWEKEEMRVWSKKFFDRDVAWAFKPLERHIFLSDNKQIAWFDETLDTWMGICRGSGVVEKTTDGWKIRHFVLSICVPNEVVNSYLPLIGKNPKK